MPKAASSAKRGSGLAASTFILDNGAYTMKAGFGVSNPSYDDCSVIPNCIANSSRDRCSYIGSQLEKCVDYGELGIKRPLQKGYVVNWESERMIWNNEFFDDDAKLKIDPKNTNLILTEAPNCIETLQKNADEMVFEYYEFASYYRSLAPALNAYNDISAIHNGTPFTAPKLPLLPPECLLLIDTGYSHTTVTPLFRGRPIQSAIRRLTIGGKMLTNYLKEQASIRHFNVMDETYLINSAKEAVSFVSDDFGRDLEAVWKGGLKDKPRKAVDTSLIVDYVLPDYETVKTGYARPHDPGRAAGIRRFGPNAGPKEDVLPLGNERFKGPELLFNPGDVGLSEAGLPAVVLQSIAGLPESLKAAMLSNVLVVGGNSLIPGFMERLSAELRATVTEDYPVRVSRAPDPVKSTWLGGARLAADRDALKNHVVTRAEYEEHGWAWLQRRFTGK